jgi:hypothetical protein
MLSVVCGAGMFHRPYGSILAGFLMLVVFFGFFGVITLAGWRMFNRWTPSTIREYAFIQALLTGIALCHLLHSGTDMYGVYGLLAAVFFARPLHYVIRRCLERTGNYPGAESEVPTLVPTLPKRWF